MLLRIQHLKIKIWDFSPSLLCPKDPYVYNTFDFFFSTFVRWKIGFLEVSVSLILESWRSILLPSLRLQNSFIDNYFVDKMASLIGWNRWEQSIILYFWLKRRKRKQFAVNFLTITLSCLVSVTFSTLEARQNERKDVILLATIKIIIK